ncbi:MAG TPA: outer membrane beta-barrel protein [Polyangiaceae bacterium]|nr:outer membrane beta-barrel protein [Polyangiaceae bacterium]
MIRASLIGLAVVCLSQWAHAEEANVGAVGNIGAAPVTSTGGESFASPNGQLGAGLTSSPEQKGRAFVELGFGRASTSESETEGGITVDAEFHYNVIPIIVGGGYKITPNLELVAMLPIGWGNVGYSVTATGGPGLDALNQDQSESGVGVGNLHLGLNYFSFDGPVRFMAGGAIQFGPWYKDYDPGPAVGAALGHPAGGGQDIGLYRPETVSIVAPGRVEYPIDRVVLAGDAALGLHIPTDGADAELSIQVAPGVGYYLTPTAQLGLRVPFAWLPTDSGSSATYLAVEPYARFDFEKLFLTARFDLNIDEPYGFSFDSGKFWGIHVGLGSSF